MKNNLYLIFFFYSVVLYSQTTIGPDAIVRLGEEEPTVFLDFSIQNWDSQTSGENQNWIYNSLLDGQLCNNKALDPDTSIYRDSFPDSDLYFICTLSDSNGNESEEHTFYNIEGDILQLAGNVSLSISNPSYDSIFIVYTDPLDWGVFPYRFGDISHDTFEARVSSYIGTQLILAVQQGTSLQEVESYGSLTTPAGTFENTLRIKRTELAETGVPGFPITTPQESYRYTWYAENEKSTILNLDSIVIKDMNGNVQNTNYAGSYRQNGPTSSSVDNLRQDDLLIYPMPVKDQFYIDYKGTDVLDIQLIDLNGTTLFSFSELIMTGLHKSLLPVSDLPSGNYLLSIKNTEDGSYSVRKVQVAK